MLDKKYDSSDAIAILSAEIHWYLRQVSETNEKINAAAHSIQEDLDAIFRRLEKIKKNLEESKEK